MEGKIEMDASELIRGAKERVADIEDLTAKKEYMKAYNLCTKTLVYLCLNEPDVVKTITDDEQEELNIVFGVVKGMSYILDTLTEDE